MHQSLTAAPLLKGIKTIAPYLGYVALAPDSCPVIEGD